MIVEKAPGFQLEGDISVAFDRFRYCALGYIAIHIADLPYGVREPDATMMGHSYDAVARRIANRGHHTVPGIELKSARYIAASMLADYVEEPVDEDPEENDDVSDWTHWRACKWAPDGDEAFDDSSYVYQFDIGDRVRLVGVRHGEVGGTIEPGTLREVWLSADEFYGVLARWKAAFEALWESMPKTPSRA